MKSYFAVKFFEKSRFVELFFAYQIKFLEISKIFRLDRSEDADMVIKVQFGTRGKCVRSRLRV